MESCSGDIGDSFSTTKGRTGVRRQGKEGIPVWGYRYPFLAIKRSTNQNPRSRFIRGVEDRGHWAALDGVLVREIKHRLSLHWHKMVEVLLYLLFFLSFLP